MPLPDRNRRLQAVTTPGRRPETSTPRSPPTPADRVDRADPALAAPVAPVDLITPADRADPITRAAPADRADRTTRADPVAPAPKVHGTAIPIAATSTTLHGATGRDRGAMVSR